MNSIKVDIYNIRLLDWRQTHVATCSIYCGNTFWHFKKAKNEFILNMISVNLNKRVAKLTNCRKYTFFLSSQLIMFCQDQALCRKCSWRIIHSVNGWQYLSSLGKSKIEEIEVLVKIENVNWIFWCILLVINISSIALCPYVFKFFVWTRPILRYCFPFLLKGWIFPYQSRTPWLFPNNIRWA